MQVILLNLGGNSWEMTESLNKLSVTIRRTAVGLSDASVEGVADQVAGSWQKTDR